MHVNVGAGSYLEVNIPMTVTENGKLKQKKYILCGKLYWSSDPYILISISKSSAFLNISQSVLM